MFSLDLPICSTCGVQFGSDPPPGTCPICDDPRQYVPPSGQSWTSLRKLQNDPEHYHNEIYRHEDEPDMYSIYTVPQIAIGQRAMLVKTKAGKNVLWDCITYIDDDTVARVNQLGGIDAIVISHPHFYSCNVEWAKAFNCPVYLSEADKEWVMRKDSEVQRFYNKEVTFTEDSKAVVVGGHFPGSAVFAWKDKHLLVADSIAVVLSGLGERERLSGTTSFTFMYSYPNMIPLDPDSILGIWTAVKDLEFDQVHAGWIDRVVSLDAKNKLLESAKIIVRAMGYVEHAMFEEKL